jgi:hypothetical protein
MTSFREAITEIVLPHAEVILVPHAILDGTTEEIAQAYREWNGDAPAGGVRAIFHQNMARWLRRNTGVTVTTFHDGSLDFDDSELLDFDGDAAVAGAAYFYILAIVSALETALRDPKGEHRYRYAIDQANNAIILLDHDYIWKLLHSLKAGNAVVKPRSGGAREERPSHAKAGPKPSRAILILVALVIGLLIIF